MKVHPLGKGSLTISGATGRPQGWSSHMLGPLDEMPHRQLAGRGQSSPMRCGGGVGVGQVLSCRGRCLSVDLA